MTQPKCGAVTKRGGRCRNKAIVGSGQCARHQGRWTRGRAAQGEIKEAQARLRELRKKKWAWW